MKYAVKVKSAKKPEKETIPTGKVEILPSLIVDLIENFTLTGEAEFGATEGEAVVSNFTIEREVEMREEVVEGQTVEVMVDNKEALLETIEAEVAGLEFYEVVVHLCTHGTDTPGPCSPWVVERSVGDVPEVGE